MAIEDKLQNYWKHSGKKGTIPVIIQAFLDEDGVYEFSRCLISHGYKIPEAKFSNIPRYKVGNGNMISFDLFSDLYIRLRVESIEKIFSRHGKTLEEIENNENVVSVTFHDYISRKYFRRG